MDPWGALGEQYVGDAFRRWLGDDFVFWSPKYRTPTGDQELCDFAILLDQSVVLIEVKTADRFKRPSRDPEAWARFSQQRLDKATVQLHCAIDAILDGKVRSMTNARQGKTPLDMAAIKHISCIVVIDHPELGILGRQSPLTVQGRYVPVLTSTHEDLNSALEELSTPGDLMDYLEVRGEFGRNHAMTGCTELDVLAAYKMYPDNFEAAARDNRIPILVEPGLWKSFVQHPGRLRRNRRWSTSHVVDTIINVLHTVVDTEPSDVPHLGASHASREVRLSAYRYIINELAKVRRVDRIEIGKMIVDKSEQCVKSGRCRFFGTASKTGRGSSFVFIISEESRAARLDSLCFCVDKFASEHAVNNVIGFALPPVHDGRPVEVDFVMPRQDQVRSETPQTRDDVRSEPSIFGEKEDFDRREFD